MRVLMLIGPPAIGKTTFAKSLAAKHDSIFIDLKDFQPKYMSWEDIQKSYDMAEKELRKAVSSKENENKLIIFEHTLLKKKRRPQYINAIKEENSSITIDCIVLSPKEETFYRNVDSRFSDFVETDYVREEYISAFDVFEMPTLDEGYRSIGVIKY